MCRLSKYLDKGNADCLKSNFAVKFKKETVMDFADVMALVGTAGGVQGVVELVKWWTSRHLRKREDEAGVSALESDNVRKQIDWLETRLAERDRKLDSLYSELRQEQAGRVEEIHLRHEVELRLAEADARKCLVRGCDKRQPPSEY